MYNIGELIFYGKTGVCKIEEITKGSSPVTGEEEDFYILKPLYQECKISIPVHNEKIFMRKIVSKDEAVKLIEGIKDINAVAFYCHNLNQLKEHYREIMNSHDCEKMIELILSVCVKRTEALKNKKKLGAVDERFMKEAEELIHGEFSASLGITREEVSEVMKKKIKEVIYED